MEKNLLPLTLGSPFARNLDDDVAKIDDLLIKTDSLCEGVHTKIGTSPHKMGHKLLARALSDIASKGGFPIAFTLSVFKTSKISEAFLHDFANGMKVFGVPLIGGDIASSLNENFCANVTVFAKQNAQTPHRNGAKEGDFIYTTGQIGRAFLGFSNETEFLPFYETPLPKLKLMQEIIAKFKINSSIDISDGFMKDLLTLLQTSNIGAEIDFSFIPIPKTSCNVVDLLTFGDDYEVIFTSPNEIINPDITKIGTIQRSELIFTNTPQNLKFKTFGFESLT